MLKLANSITEFMPRHKPYKHQSDDLKLSRDMEYYAFFWEMGLGKTKILIDTASWLFMKQRIDGVLIIAPKGVFLNWLTDELPAHVPSNIPHRIAYWNSDMKKSDIPACQKILGAKEDMLDFLAINTEALATEKGMRVAENFIQNHHTMCILDESDSIKNPAAIRTKAIIKLGKKCAYRRIATGTPITQSPLDLYSQCEFLFPKLLRFPSYFQFKQFYANIKSISAGSRSYEKIIGYRNLDELSASVQPFSSRRLKIECLDLPEKIYLTRYVEHTKEQKELYNRLSEEAMVFLSEESVVSSTSVLTTMMKLHQINCGHVTDDDGNIQTIPSNRINVMLDALQGIPKKSKVLVWANFKQDVRMIVEAISIDHGRESVGHYYGDTSSTQRAENLLKFKNDPEFRFLVLSSAGAKGLTLINSFYSLYYSQGYNLAVRLQSEDRNHRIGQTEKVTYIDLITRRTVDVNIVGALRAKKNIATSVLDGWRNLLILLKD
jgi:SNF2 family DNA or RNA helicase